MKLTQELIDKIQEAMLHTNLKGEINWKDGDIHMVVRDKKNDTSNEYAVYVGETDQTFEFNFKVENIKIIPGAYDVVISSKLLSEFTNKQYNLKYFIALEPDSTFG